MRSKTSPIRTKIIETAWDLFLKQGYEGTTIHQIIETSQTSRGGFYHHFHGKEELLFCLAYFFDQDYETWLGTLDTGMNTLDILLTFDSYVMTNLENSPYKPFLASLYGLQVMTEGQRYILNPERPYYQFIAKLMKEGLEKGEIKSDLSHQELTEWFAIIERGFTYDWCLNQCRYSLVKYGQRMMKIFLDSLKA